MKYRQLTKEQFESLHEEFAGFLATQQIDVKEWEEIKQSKPELAEEEMNVFSDIVWEDVLNKTRFLEHISEHHINLFQCNSKEIIRVYIHWKDPKRSFLEQTDFQWFKSNFLHDSIEYYKAVKSYNEDRNTELFDLIEKGSEISDGSLYKAVIQVIS